MHGIQIIIIKRRENVDNELRKKELFCCVRKGRLQICARVNKPLDLCIQNVKLSTN